MDARDLAAFASRAVLAQPLRSALSMLGIAIGVAAVVLLSSIGEGTRAYVVDQFTSFGTNILSVTPGKTKTTGIPGVLGGTTRKLSIEDALALERLPGVAHVMPETHGQARVEAGERGRSVPVYGLTHELLAVWSIGVSRGTFLPPGDPRRGSAVAVLGPKLERELFGAESSVGRHVRIGGARLRVVGVLEPKGNFLGIDLDDAAYLPLATHMQVFDLEELDEIAIAAADARGIDALAERVRETLTARHDGEDFTITTQAAMIDVLGGVLGAVTLAVGAIAAISLVVGAIGILTVLSIAVEERTGEIGLLRAIGAPRGAVLAIFLVEASALAASGAAAGLALALAALGAVRAFAPRLPLAASGAWIAAALATGIGSGLVAGIWPARRATALDPIEALRAE